MVMSVAPENRGGGTAAGLSWGLLSSVVSAPIPTPQRTGQPRLTPLRGMLAGHTQTEVPEQAGFTLKPGPSAPRTPTSQPWAQLTELRYGEGAPEA